MLGTFDCDAGTDLEDPDAPNAAVAPPGILARWRVVVDELLDLTPPAPPAPPPIWTRRPLASLTVRRNIRILGTKRVTSPKRFSSCGFASIVAAAVAAVVVVVLVVVVFLVFVKLLPLPLLLLMLLLLLLPDMPASF